MNPFAECQKLTGEEARQEYFEKVAKEAISPGESSLEKSYAVQLMAGLMCFFHAKTADEADATPARMNDWIGRALNVTTTPSAPRLREAQPPDESTTTFEETTVQYARATYQEIREMRNEQRARALAGPEAKREQIIFYRNWPDIEAELKALQKEADDHAYPEPAKTTIRFMRGMIPGSWETLSIALDIARRGLSTTQNMPSPHGEGTS